MQLACAVWHDSTKCNKVSTNCTVSPLMVAQPPVRFAFFFSRGSGATVVSPAPRPASGVRKTQKSSIILQAAAALYTHLCVDTRSSPDHGAATYVGPPGDGFTAQSLCPLPRIAPQRGPTARRLDRRRARNADVKKSAKARTAPYNTRDFLTVPVAASIHGECESSECAVASAAAHAHQHA